MILLVLTGTISLPVRTFVLNITEIFVVYL